MLSIHSNDKPGCCRGASIPKSKKGLLEPRQALGEGFLGEGTIGAGLERWVVPSQLFEYPKG